MLISNENLESIICNEEKASITDVFWSRFSPAGKNHYKELAKQYNKENKLTGRRKTTGFWTLAQILMKELGKKELSGSFIFTLFEKMDKDVINDFVGLNTNTPTFRRRVFLDVLRDETSLLL